MMIKAVLSLFLLLWIPLSADIQPISVESDTADYQNQQATLSGNVKIQHPLGTLQAGHALLTSHADGSVEKIQLSEGVFVHLHDGTTLQCAEASFNGEAAAQPTIHCLSSASTPCRLTYHSNSTISCQQATLFLSKTGSDGRLAITTIEASGGVRLQKESSSKDPLSGYAIADTLTYNAQTEEAILKALPGQRVRVFDPVKNSKMSAEAVLIKKHPATGKELIQAKGHVQLIFDRQRPY